MRRGHVARSIVLPSLRRGCLRDTALSLEYRESGGESWRVYTDAFGDSGIDGAGLGKSTGESSLRVSLPREHSRQSVEFRLRAHRGAIVSEPSAPLGPIQTCDDGPRR